MFVQICANSLTRLSSDVLAITPLSLRNLAIYEETHSDGSNHFIYTRFLIPHLMQYKGWALFLDGDMIVRDDIAKLFAMRDESKAVMCVHHDYQDQADDKVSWLQERKLSQKKLVQCRAVELCAPGEPGCDAGFRDECYRCAASPVYVA